MIFEKSGRLFVSLPGFRVVLQVVEQEITVHTSKKGEVMAPIPKETQDELKRLLEEDNAVVTARLDQMVAQAKTYFYEVSDTDIAVKIGERAYEFLQRSLHAEHNGDNEQAAIDALMYYCSEIGVLYCLHAWGAHLARCDAAREGYVDED